MVGMRNQLLLPVCSVLDLRVEEREDAASLRMLTRIDAASQRKHCLTRLKRVEIRAQAG